MPTGPEGATPTLRAALGGLSALRGDWPALSLLVIMTTGFVIGGALDVLALAFVTGPLGLEQTAAGLLLSATGLGGLVGAALASSPARRRRLVGTVTTTGATRGLFIAGAALFSALVPAMLLVALSGMVGAIFMVCARTLLQRAVDDRLLTRVMAVQESTAQFGLAIGAGLAPLLVAWISPRGAMVALGLGVAAVVVLAAWPVRRLDARSVFRPQETELLRTVPYFDLLPAFELERLAGKGGGATSSRAPTSYARAIPVTTSSSSPTAISPSSWTVRSGRGSRRARTSARSRCCATSRAPPPCGR